MKLIRTLLLIGVLVLVAYGISRYQQRSKKVVPVTQKVEQVTWRSTEGWTVADIISDLDQKGVVARAEFEKQLLISAQDFEYLGEKPTTPNLEGYLFPDTYFFTKGGSAAQVINKILANTEAKIDGEILNRIKAQKRSIRDIIILASIVEKEVGRNTSTISKQDLTTLKNEREIVAGIFKNRLDIGMPLQSDATLGYITKSKSPSATYKDLELDSPYNTYKYKGLPPGPISNPSLSAILAVVDYRDTDYLYFLSKPDGTAVYGRTLEEHNANKARYLR